MYRVRLGANFAPRAALSLAVAILSLQVPLRPAQAADAAAAVVLPAPKPAPAKLNVLPEQVTAVYKISFGLLGKVGTFQFKSNIDGAAYNLSADAKIDTTVFDYLGLMTSSGLVQSAMAKPIGYQFRYQQKALLGKKKVRSLSMAFDGTGVQGVKFVPPDEPSAKAIPVTKEQLRNALDPLSGVMALSLGNVAHPCDQKLAIFDGKQRFDLVFQPTGRFDGPGQVCRVRLIPISGHKKGEGADSVISGNIEVVLRPVPKANILVPYRVTVPTIIGAAVLTSERVDITMPNQQRIALRR